MKAKRITALLIALTLTAALSACGSEKDDTSVSATEKTTGEVIEEATGDAIEEVTGEAIEVTDEAVDVAGQEETSVPETTTKRMEEATEPKKSEPAAKTHTHNWKEHTAEQQVWVSNIVTVDDYEEQQIPYDYFECACGTLFDTQEELDAHQEATSWEAYFNGTLDTYPCHPRDNVTSYIHHMGYNTENVKVGSHEEDHGHYETTTYIDYYYCDCGAKK